LNVLGERTKHLRLACWNADGVRGRKLELGHLLNQHGVDISLLNETLLNDGQAFQLANYVCHRTNRSKAGGGTAIFVRQSIVCHSVPIPGVTHLEAIAIQVTIASKPVKILTAYLSSFRPLIGADQSACFEGEMPVLMAGDFNDKHMD
jgi:exonuclease III